MQIKTAVIQIDRAAGGAHAVRDKLFGMDKSRHKLINLHTMADQILVVRPGNRIDQPLVGNVRHDDGNLHPALRGVDERRDHLVIQNQIRRHDVHIVLRPVQNIHVNRPPDEVIIVRIIPERHDKSAFFRALQL